MSLFDSLGGAAQQPQQMTMQDAMRQLQQNPSDMLKRAGLNVPNGMNNPQQIVNHLLQSGQVPQNRLTMAMQMAQRMGLLARR